MPSLETTPDSKRRAIEVAAMLLLMVVFLAVSLIRQPFGNGADLSQTIGVILAAGLTLIMYSFLYRDNPLFKIAENLYVGITLGYTAILTWRQALRPEVFDPIFRSPSSSAFSNEMLHRFVPILLGVLLLTRLSRKYGWLSRYSYATMIGWGAGIGIMATTQTFILQQLHAAIAPFQEGASGKAIAVTGAGWTAVFSWPYISDVVLPIVLALTVMIGTVAVLFYFFFSIEHKRASGVISKIGIWFLMVSFGASFGYTVMGRVSLLIGRVQFLLFDWLKMPK
jgi:hypothetical protein